MSSRADSIPPELRPHKSVLKRRYGKLALPKDPASLNGGLCSRQRGNAGYAVGDGRGANLSLIGSRSLAARRVDDKGDLAVLHMVKQVRPPLLHFANHFDFDLGRS